MTGIIILGLLVLLVVLGIGMYNSLVRLKVQTDNAWADIDVQLKRRYDLIPNLVETVKGYAGHERGTLEAVIKARQAAVAAPTLDQKVAAENALSGTLRPLLPLSSTLHDTSTTHNITQRKTEHSEHTM